MSLARQVVFFLVPLMAVACTAEAGAGLLPAPEATASLAAVEPIPFDPTSPEVVFGEQAAPNPLFFNPDEAMSVASLADIPGNLATGQPAPDFEARLAGGETFRLATARGRPLLLIPTALGCAECVANLRALAVAYPDFRHRGLAVLVVDLVTADDPALWQRFADYLDEPNLQWSVALSPSFAVDYAIGTLGTVLLVDAKGRIVFRSEYPLSADGFRQLLDLATAPAGVPAGNESH